MQALSQWKGLLVCIAIGALGWRLWVLSRLARGPLLDHLVADAWVYWSWSSELLAGIHGPRQPFFLGPLYPYGLAAIRVLFGSAIPTIATVQCLIGTATVAIITDAARRLSSTRSALITGIVLALYPLAVLFNMLMLMETAVLFLEALLMWLIVRHRSGIRGEWVGLIAMGSCIGLVTLGRATGVLLAFPVAWVVWKEAGTAAGALKRLAIMAIAAVLFIAPATLHNWQSSREFIPVTYSLGYNLFVGNGSGANGTSREIADVVVAPSAEGGTAGDGRDFIVRTTGQRMSAAESSRYWLGRTIKQIRTQPMQWLGLCGRKLLLMFNHSELPQIENPKSFAKVAGALGLPVDWAFAWFGILGLWGVCWAWRMSGTERAIVLWLAAMTIGTVAFFVVDRYRVHLVVPLALLASIAIDRLTKPRSLGAKRIMAAALVTAVVLAPMVPASKAHDAWAFASTMGQAWLARSQPDSAVGYLQQAVAIQESGTLPAAQRSETKDLFGATYLELGVAYEYVGNAEEAVRSMRRGLEMLPEAVDTRLRLIGLLARSAGPDEAALEVASKGMDRGVAAEWLTAEATRWSDRDVSAMTNLLRAAVAVQPGYEPALVPLVRMYVYAQSVDDASALLNEGFRQGLDPNVYWAHRAWIAQIRGDTSGARQAMERIAEESRTSDARVVSTLQMMNASPR